MRDSDLSLNERIVIVMLTSRANEQGRAHPSLQRIADDCGMSRRSAIRAIADLESKGWIRCSRQRAEKQHIPSVYTVVQHRSASEMPVPQSHQGSDRESPPLVTESHQGGDHETPRVVTDSHRGGDRESPKLPNELPIQLPTEDLGDEPRSEAPQLALSDADLVWLKLSQGTKRKLTPQREAAILDALKQLGTVDAVIAYLDAAKAKTGKDWTAALASGEPLRIFGAYALELFASEGKLPASPKAERPDPPEVREAFVKVRDKYFAEFDLARGTKPAFGGDDGRAIKQLLIRCGVESNPERAAERACDAVAGAFADSFHKDKCSIQTIAKDPNKFMGRVPRVQQGGERQEFRLHKRSPANPQPDGRPLSDFAEGGWTNG
ncbi:MAG: helix-turn-helix domain-containing protein [Polyangiaceae bacterium]|nr:helix-turn-helix domain-containing protein [Polyangiaceae bacterium]